MALSFRLFAPLLAVLLLAGPGRGVAAELAVDLELVLAVDVSGSIDPDEAQLQRNGYVQAFLNPKVADAIRSGPHGRIAVTYVEWAGDHHQETVIGWTLLDGGASLGAFADRLAETPVGHERWTSISGALGYAVGLFDGNGFEGIRRVIDVSGDGFNNSGPPLTPAHDAVLARGITINGLPIVNDRPNPWGGEPTRGLEAYYRDYVIGGPGAFLVVAEGFGSFAEAILSKLLLEIAGIKLPSELAACPRCADAP